jgi:hypothetical protein
VAHEFVQPLVDVVGKEGFAASPRALGPTVQDPCASWCMDAPRRDTNQMPALLETFVCEILARDDREILEEDDIELGRNRERPIDAEPRCWRQKKKISRNVKERSMDEGAGRLSVLTLCSDLTAHSVQFVALVVVERLLPAYYASMLRDKNLATTGSSKAQWKRRSEEGES